MVKNKKLNRILGLWEQFSTPDFKRIEFDAFKNEAGSNSFTLTPKKWINATNAIGIVSGNKENEELEISIMLIEKYEDNPINLSSINFIACSLLCIKCL